MKFTQTILLILLSISVFCQKKFDIDTTIIVGKDKGIFQQRNILIDSENNIYTAGLFKGNLTIENSTISTNSPLNYYLSQAIFVVKYDKNNKFIWLKKIAECDTLNNFSWAKSKNNNFQFAIGYSGKIFFETDSFTSSGNEDILLIKYDSGFTFKYYTNIGNYNGESITKNSLKFDNYENCYLTGSFNNTWFGNYQNYTLIIGMDTLTANNEDMFIVKFDTLGNAIWAKSYGGNGIDGNSYITCYKNSLFFCGNFGSDIDNYIGNIHVIYPNNYYSCCFLSKLDSNGNVIWVRKFGSKYNNALGAVGPRYVVIKNDKIYFTAYGNDQNQLEFLFDGGPNLLGIAGASTFESFVACYDTAGNFKWRKLVPDVTYPSQLTVDSNSNVIGIGGNDFTLKVFSYDSTGAFNWQAVSDADNLCTTVGGGITQDTHGKLYIVGGTTCNPLYMGNDTLHPPVGQSTLFYASLDSINAQWAVNTQDINRSSNSIRIYPNPAKNLLVLENINANVAIKTITISNIQAQVVYKTTTTENKININTSTLPNGVYSIQYKTNKEFVTQKIIIQH